jgi:hypothetical protein
MNNPMLSLLPAHFYLQVLWQGSKYLENRRFRSRQQKRTVATQNGYSFKPFDDTRSIFIHIPKCAGLSISQALYGNQAGGHTTLSEYLRIFEPEAILSYYKFTIVRNPWDRLVSAYHFLKGGGLTMADKTWADTELGIYADFDMFVRRWVNSRNIWKWHHFRPQYHYVTDRYGKVAMDFVGRFENLNEDFDLISRRIGLDRNLPARNRSNHDCYTGYYSDATRKIVEEVYGRDIALFQYKFEK